MRLSSHNLPDTTAPSRPHVTVFCAVWHKQPNKLELLKSHWDNLKRQSIPVEPCYIFDNGDTAPEWLAAPWHSFSEPLTIYEAWAAGVALARTRFVMNLNMDDRLSTDAAEMMLRGLLQTDTALIGGEWIIQFDHAFQTEVFGSSDPKQTCFEPAWPPAPIEGDKRLRLGSGMGERGTLGPATLWDLEKTQRWYPTHFGNRDPILSIGDAIFWQHLHKKKLRTARLPLVIGRYFSSPDAQAEFRPHNDEENLRTHGVHEVSFAQSITATRNAMPQPAPQGASPFPKSRNAIENESQALALKYLGLLGHGTPAASHPRA
ncbi:glycosyltransferase family 2 protein [Tritonibacter mobilis]|uniref:glycosyltransferase family 2 protein n=1 Tax=Tritonibacter mobilis TaxID=379347 RepID=UPI003A5C2B76